MPKSKIKIPIYLMGVHLTDVHVMEIHFIGMHLIGVSLIWYFPGQTSKERSGSLYEVHPKV